jgi:hypothetical protein
MGSRSKPECFAYLYYGAPTHAVELAQETYALEIGGPATALAASVEAFAQAELGNELATRRALRHSEELFKRLNQEDSVFGFTERRQLSTEAGSCFASVTWQRRGPH